VLLLLARRCQVLRTISSNRQRVPALRASSHTLQAQDKAKGKANIWVPGLAVGLPSQRSLPEDSEATLRIKMALVAV
jgi:hypothetical protein